MIANQGIAGIRCQVGKYQQCKLDHRESQFTQEKFDWALEIFHINEISCNQVIIQLRAINTVRFWTTGVDGLHREAQSDVTKIAVTC